MNDKQHKLIDEILGDEFTQRIAAEFGLSHETPETQAELISKVGETIMGRVILELAKAIPAAERSAFESFISSGDLVGMREFLLKYIPNLDEFIQEQARKEYGIIQVGMQAS